MCEEKGKLPREMSQNRPSTGRTTCKFLVINHGEDKKRYGEEVVNISEEVLLIEREWEEEQEPPRSEIFYF